MTHDKNTLAEGLHDSGLSYENLWTRYFALGGSRTLDNMRDRIDNPDMDTDDAEHNVIAQALNDYFVEQGKDHPVAYRNLPGPPVTD